MAELSPRSDRLDRAMDRFLAEMPPDISARELAIQLGLDPVMVFRVASATREAIAARYDDGPPPPTPTAKPNAMAADLFITGIALGVELAKEPHDG